MRIKLKLNELLAVGAMLSNSCAIYRRMHEEGTMDMEEKLREAVMEELTYHFVQVSIKPVQKKYSIKLKPHWALAFHLEYSGLVNRTDFAGNLVQTICDKIHQHYC
jgi:hypothetical protein